MDRKPNLIVLIVERVVISKGIAKCYVRNIFTRVPVKLKRGGTDGQVLARTRKNPQSPYQ